MALPARKLEPAERRARHPRLRVVARQDLRRPSSAQARRGSVRCAPGEAARQNFRMLAVIVVLLTALGLVRVWLSVQAAEASIDSYELRREIKAERYRGDMLEVQQSALSSPSRIRALAGATMDMTAVGEAMVIDLPSAEPSRRVASRPTRPGGARRLLDEAVKLAAGEAQVLLVGDVGLATAR